MKKKLIIILFIVLSANSAAFAYVSNKSINQQPIYCPDKIECKLSEKKNIVCSVIGDHLQYWRAANKIPGGPIGNYEFYLASTTYHYNGLEPATCSYKYKGSDPFPVMDVFFTTQVGTHFEALYDKSTKWNIIGKNADCISDKPSQCPMVESNSFVISQFLAQKDDYYDSSKNIPIMIAANGKVFPHDQNAAFFEITYDDAINMCGSISQCTFYIRDGNDMPYKYDTIVVDIANNMKIVQINPAMRDKSGYRLEKHKLYNMIRFTLLK